MADIDYDAFVDQAGALTGVRRVKKLTNGAGAALSVVLILGLAVWGYRIAVRDARGVPVVMALEGPMRIAPVDPGGEQMAHQGLAVNSVAAVGEVAAPADRLVLAPRPVELSDSDQAGYAPIPPSAVVPTLTSTIPIPGQFADEGSSTAALEGDPADIEAEPEAAAPDPVVADVAPLLPPTLAEAAPEVAALAETAAADAVAVAVDAALAEAVADQPPLLVNATAFAVAQSLYPRSRPVAASAPVQANEAAPEPAGAETEVAAAAAVAPGTRLVQLGAYPDVAAAHADWQKLTANYTDYFKGKSRMVQAAVSGGKTFYRLRALGFADEDEARRLCAVLTNDQVQCIPVLTR